MKTLYYILLFLPLVLHAQDRGSVNGIKFERASSWEQIKLKAQNTSKYIFVDCYATWCGPCKEMDRDVYTNSLVGNALNEYFISVKVQMDSTEKDNDLAKMWYPTAQKMMREHKITAFPTYLFFSPEGKLVHKESGYMNIRSFVRLSELARDPQKPFFYKLYEDYKRNKKNYPTMGRLAMFTRDLIGDSELANSMAKDYKNHLDKLELSSISTKENIDFICNFSNLIDSKDKYFELCYKHPAQFDSIRGVEGTAKRIVNQTVTREEIANKLLNNGRATVKTPDWEYLELNLAKKYKSLDARKLILNYKIHYYRDIHKDWALWAKYKDEMIKTYPPTPPYGLTVYRDLNGYGGAWHAFLYCPNSAILIKALEWVELAIKIDGEDKYLRAAYLDTKANLLYKLGRVEEALKLEKQAIDLSAGGDNSEFLQAYAKMQRGEPTWIVQ